MNLIEFSWNNKSIWVNVDHIVAVTTQVLGNINATTIVLGPGVDDEFCVDQSVAEVIHKIQPTNPKGATQ